MKNFKRALDSTRIMYDIRTKLTRTVFAIYKSFNSQTNCTFRSILVYGISYLRTKPKSEKGRAIKDDPSEVYYIVWEHSNLIRILSAPNRATYQTCISHLRLITGRELYILWSVMKIYETILSYTNRQASLKHTCVP